MKRGSTLFLRGAVFAISIAVLALCVFGLPAIWSGVEPEYSDIASTLYALLVIMYAAAVPFFIGAYHTLRLVGHIDKNKAFSKLSVKSLKAIKYCGVAISILYAASMPLIYQFAQRDDAPGVIVIGMVLTLAPLTISVLAGVLQRLLQEAIAMKKENELTV